MIVPHQSGLSDPKNWCFCPRGAHGVLSLHCRADSHGSASGGVVTAVVVGCLTVAPASNRRLDPLRLWVGTPVELSSGRSATFLTRRRRGMARKKDRLGSGLHKCCVENFGKPGCQHDANK